MDEIQTQSKINIFHSSGDTKKKTLIYFFQTTNQITLFTIMTYLCPVPHQFLMPVALVDISK